VEEPWLVVRAWAVSRACRGSTGAPSHRPLPSTRLHGLGHQLPRIRPRIHPHVSPAAHAIRHACNATPHHKRVPQG